jgi:hypothetical protein
MSTHRNDINGRNLLHALLLLVLLPVSLACPAHAACGSDDVNRAAQHLTMARRALLAAPMSEIPQAQPDASDWTTVPTATQQAIATMKQALADLITTYMCAAPPDVSAEKIRKGLSRLGHAFAPKKANSKLPEDSYRYGFELSFETRRDARQPTLVGIVADFQIACGSDAMLLIFDSATGRWHERLRWQSRPYAKVSGAFGSFGYAIAPPDSQGAWYVLVKRIPPWCSSTWSAIYYDVLRPVDGSLRPRVVFSGSDGIWWGAEDFGTASANAADFTVRFHNNSIDVGVHNRLWIKRYSISGDTVRRIQPVAASPRDFADEWIQEPWKEASRWTAPRARSATVETLHRRLHHKLFFDFDSVRKCSDRKDHHQVGVADSESNTTWFISVDGRSRFVMSGISRSPDPRCDGPDLLQSQ